MSELHLESMDLAELKTLQKEVNKAIVNFEERKKKEALARLEATARDMGFSVAELVGGKVARARSISPAKYANPANKSETWTGKGRQPNWYREAIAAGTPEANLMI